MSLKPVDASAEAAIRQFECGGIVPRPRVRKPRPGVAGLAAQRSVHETLIRILDEGWTTTKEVALIDRLRAMH